MGRGSGKRWGYYALREEWNRAAALVSLRVSMYEGLKHSSATDAARRGVSLEIIAQALGHSDSRITQRLHPIASVTMLRPECNLSAGEKTRSK